MEATAICNEHGILYLVQPIDEDKDRDVAQAVFGFILSMMYNVGNEQDLRWTSVDDDD